MTLATGSERSGLFCVASGRVGTGATPVASRVAVVRSADVLAPTVLLQFGGRLIRHRLLSAHTVVAIAVLGACVPTACAAPATMDVAALNHFDAGAEASVGLCNEEDDDADTLGNEVEGSGAIDTDQDGKADSVDDDTDGDGWTDVQEAAWPSAPRPNVCAPGVDSDSDGTPDFRDVDSDNDGVPDEDERDYDPDGASNCRILADCDKDGVIDLIELAAGSSPTDAGSTPTDATLYFVVPYQEPEQAKDFSFSTGVERADVYFLVDTTKSMQPAIDNVATSLNAKLIPTLLNGDAAAKPPIPAIPGAWVGVGQMADIPWDPYGQKDDQLYRNEFALQGANGPVTLGNVAAPTGSAPNFAAPDSVKNILDSFLASGGGDAPEGTTQALWMAATGSSYAATLGGYWESKPPQCAAVGMIGVPCFRHDAIPVFVLISDAPFHNGVTSTRDYDPFGTGGTKTYQQTVDALNAIGARVLGVPVDTGTPGAARADMTDLAEKTSSSYYDPAFGGAERPLVSSQDTASGSVSNEVARLIGLLAGQGVNNVTTARESYSCAGGIDCNGDGQVDLAYENPVIAPDTAPYDAAKLITSVQTVEATTSPLPYANRDDATFYGVRGEATVTFRVHAYNGALKLNTLTVLRAKIQVQTPKGQLLGGAQGVKVVYFVVPRNAGGVK